MRGAIPFPRVLAMLGAFAALALLASQLTAWLGIRRAARGAERGEAQVLMDAFHAEMRLLGRGPTEQNLEAFLERHHESGLRYVALIHPAERVEAGDGMLNDPTTDGLSRGGGRVRVAATLPGPRRPSRPAHPPPFLDRAPPPHGGPPHGGPPHGGPPDDRPPHDRPPDDGPPYGGPPPRGEGPPPLLVVEIESVLGRQMRMDSLRTLVISSIATLLFVLVAFALQRALREREAQAAAAARDRRLAALGEMSAVVAHEIRNPLASLKGHAQLLHESVASAAGSNEDRLRKKAERIVGEARRLEELTDNLLEFIRSGEPELIETDVVEVVRQASEATDDQVELALPESKVLAEVDAARLRQAFINVIENAIAASSRSGGLAPQVELEVGEESFVVRVLDRGEGMDPATMTKLFDPFFTTRTQGSGLGLAITKRIVEAHGGAIGVRSRDGGGMIFEMEVPRWHRS